MADNQTYILKIGEVGSVMTTTLKSAGAPAILTGKTITMSARKTTTATPVIDDVACSISGDPILGVITYTFDSSSANVEKGDYLLEFKVSGGGRTDYFPKDENDRRTYAKLIVQESL
jgi:hypothetical protein